MGDLMTIAKAFVFAALMALLPSLTVTEKNLGCRWMGVKQ
jgi:hypothetical protein